MPSIRVSGAEIHYEDHGAGPEAVIFAHGLLFSGRMFDSQVNALKDRYRCITFDFRGQGQSAVTTSGYDIETLSEDAAALIDALQCSPCHFVGLSMGGFVGLRLAIRRPHLIRSLVLLGTSADPESEDTARRYRLLNFVARRFGLRIVVDRVMLIMFGKKFLSDPARAELRHQWRQHILANHRIGITRAVTGVVTREGVGEQLGTITAPTLIIVGDQDVAMPPAKAERIQASIRGARLVVIPGAGHTPTVEEPAAVNAALKEFLGGLVT